ncbi:MAG: hypothetical protein NW205_04390 [Hyphomicrobiaceae bacterium]|nr:hypothetical protein [Hyphomicrobiaceae bacterium]
MDWLFDKTWTGYLWDYSVVDLVLWYPHLTWTEFLAAATCVLAWNFLSDRLWTMFRAALARIVWTALGPGANLWLVWAVRLVLRT